MSRAPLPSRESFASDADRHEYDWVWQRVEKLTGRTPADIPYVGACLNSPSFAASLWRFSGRMLAAFSTADTFTHADRDVINIVLAFDTGNYVMVARGEREGHLLHAVEHLGLRPEMPKAVWENRLEDLTDDERQLVDYIRAYVSGTVTDEMWAGIVERFGGVRAAVEYTLTIGYNLLCCQSMMAFGIPAISREQMESVIDRLQHRSEEARERTANLDRALRDSELLSEMAAG
jgi:hypothetical protein